MQTPGRPLVATMLAGILALGAVIFTIQEARTGQVAIDTIVPTFRVRGSIRGVYPGHTAVMKVKIRNRYDFPIRIKLVRAKPIAKRLSCPADYLRIRDWRGNKHISPNSVRKVRLRVRLKPTAPNACRGARWTLVYAGRAIRA